MQAYRNTVPVPRHWSQKRKYLQGKRGLEKPPFKLPDFIEATGIGEMRQAYQEKARPFLAYDPVTSFCSHSKHLTF
jgi:splicing factor 3B subunit 2